MLFYSLFQVVFLDGTGIYLRSKRVLDKKDIHSRQKGEESAFFSLYISLVGLKKSKKPHSGWLATGLDSMFLYSQKMHYCHNEGKRKKAKMTHTAIKEIPTRLTKETSLINLTSSPKPLNSHIFYSKIYFCSVILQKHSHT